MPFHELMVPDIVGTASLLLAGLVLHDQPAVVIKRIARIFFLMILPF